MLTFLDIANICLTLLLGIIFGVIYDDNPPKEIFGKLANIFFILSVVFLLVFVVIVVFMGG